MLRSKAKKLILTASLCMLMCGCSASTEIIIVDEDIPKNVMSSVADTTTLKTDDRTAYLGFADDNGLITANTENGLTRFSIDYLDSEKTYLTDTYRSVNNISVSLSGKTAFTSEGKFYELNSSNGQLVNVENIEISEYMTPITWSQDSSNMCFIIKEDSVYNAVVYDSPSQELTVVSDDILPQQYAAILDKCFPLSIVYSDGYCALKFSYSSSTYIAGFDILGENICIEECSASSDVVLLDENMYFITPAHKLVRMPIGENQKFVIATDASNFCITDKYIFYTSKEQNHDTIYRSDIHVPDNTLPISAYHSIQRITASSDGSSLLVYYTNNASTNSNTLNLKCDLIKLNS